MAEHRKPLTHEETARFLRCEREFNRLDAEILAMRNKAHEMLREADTAEDMLRCAIVGYWSGHGIDASIVTHQKLETQPDGTTHLLYVTEEEKNGEEAQKDTPDAI